MIILDILKDTDIGAVLGYVGSFAVAIGTIYKFLKSFYDKIMNEIQTSRKDNVELTEGIRDELMKHTSEDGKKFDEINTNFKDLFNVSNRTDEKVTLLINNKIKN